MRANTLLVAVATPIMIAMLFLACAVMDLAAVGSVISAVASISILLVTVSFVVLLTGVTKDMGAKAEIYEINAKAPNSKKAA